MDIRKLVLGGLIASAALALPATAAGASVTPPSHTYSQADKPHQGHSCHQSGHDGYGKPCSCPQGRGGYGQSGKGQYGQSGKGQYGKTCGCGDSKQGRGGYGQSGKGQYGKTCGCGDEAPSFPDSMFSWISAPAQYTHLTQTQCCPAGGDPSKHGHETTGVS
jgi:hypothetical protein